MMLMYVYVIHVHHTFVCTSPGEALGAIGDPSVLDLLKEYSQDPVVEVKDLHLR